MEENVTGPDLTALFDDVQRDSGLAAALSTFVEQYKTSQSVATRAAESTPDRLGASETAGCAPVSQEVGGEDGLATRASTTQTIGGYEVVSELGRGGMGVVYQARQLGLKRTVALKMVLAGLHAGEEQLIRFRAEAEAAARLQHPNIVQIYEIGEHAGLPFFSLEYVDGGSLAQKLDGTPQPPVEAARMVELLARAVHAAHQRGVVHRDLKPANVLLTAEGAPKISDFGLAKQVQVGDATDLHTRTGAILGTPSYMAPEQAAGRAEQITPRTDVYALGAILYEMLVGRPPYRASTPLETVLQVLKSELVAPRLLNADVPRDLETIAAKCLEKEPSRRYESAAVLADELDRFLAGRPILARPVGNAERLVRWARRNPRIAGLSAAVALLLVLLAGGSLTAALVLNEAWRKERAALAAETSAKNEVRTALAEETAAKEAARKAIENYVTSVMSDELVRDERFQPLRKSLLADALAYYRDFVRDHRHDPASRRALADAQSKMQRINSWSGSWNDALEAARQAVALLEQLAAESQQDAELQSKLANALHELAVVQDGLGRTQEAEATLHRALAIADSVAPGERGRQGWQRVIGDCRHALSIVQSTQGHAQKALPNCDLAIEAYQRLTADDPDNFPVQAALAASYSHRGNALVKLGRFPEAIAAHRQAIELRQEIARRDPTLLRQTELGQSHNNLGLMLVTIGDSRAADEFRQALAIFERAVAQFPNMAEGKSMLAAVHSNFGLLHEGQGNLDAAAASYHQGLSLYQRLLADNPDVAAFSRGAALNLRNLGEVQRGLGDLDAALTSQQGSLEEYRRLAERTDRSLEDRLAVGRGLESIGLTQVERKEHEQALSSFRDSLEISQGVLAEFPNDLMCRSDIGNSYNNQGWTLHLMGRFDEALAAFQQGLPFQEQVLKQTPLLIQFRQALSNHLDGLIETYRSLKQPEPAVAACLSRKKLWPGQPEQLYEVAAMLANCVALVGSDASPTPQEQLQRDQYAAVVLATLQEAIAAGLQNRQRLQSEPVWEPLRRYPQFESLAEKQNQLP